MSRQAGAAFLTRAIADGLAECTEPPFADIAADNPFCKDIQWMKTAGVTTGYGDNTFGPSGPMSRQAMAAWIFAAGSL